ncbi:hypothetical protein [Streptomyces sp. CAU 1734]|uniref:hypothetical protein n=1 Tax=Streptomyces sp. CAU 1734 TaxID=3140360 RepID=UPI003260C512
MTEVVLCHGIGYQFKHRETALTDWYEALRLGMTDTIVPVPAPERVDAVFYGNCYRSRNAKGTIPEDEFAGIPPLRAGDVRDPWEKRFLEVLADGAEDPSPGGEGPKGKGPKGHTQDFLRKLEGSDRLGRPPARVVIHLARQVRRYLDENDTVRACALERFRRVVTPETRVIIGHSLGSVVAYEALCAHRRDWNVDTFITLGSPLGIREIQDRLLPGLEPDGRREWPKVKRWINVAAEDDPVALVKELAPAFGDRIEDRSVVNSGIGRIILGGHNALRYLTTTEVAEGVADALRR